MTEELELAISCLHYLTDDDKKPARENLGKLVKTIFIKEFKKEFPQYDKKWLEEDISVFVGTLRSDNHFGVFKAVSSYYKLFTEVKFRIKETVVKDSRNTIYSLEMKWDDGSMDDYLLVKDGTGYVREALDTDRDFIKRYKEIKSPTLNQSAEEIIGNVAMENSLNQLKDIGSTAFAIRKLIKDNNCCLKVIDGKVYLQHLNYLVILN